MTSIDWRRQFTDPNYSIIKTAVTNYIDRNDNWRGRFVSRVTPADWGNWFS